MILMLTLTAILGVAEPEMQMSDSVKIAVQMVSAFEQFAERPYKDADGRWRIGYGRVVESPDDWTNKQVESLWLHSVLSLMQARVLAETANSPLSLTNQQLAAVSSLIYNIGEPAFYESTLWKAIKNSKIHEIVANWKRWIRVGGKVSNGLIFRRQAEVEVFSGRAPQKAINVYLKKERN